MTFKALAASLLVATFATSAFAAETQIQFQMIGDENELDVEKVNEQLRKKKLEVIPNPVVVNLKGQRAFLKMILKRIEAARKAGVITEDDQFIIENGYLHNYPTICYRGKIDEVPAIIEAMNTIPADEIKNKNRDAWIRYDQGIIGYAWGKNRKPVADYLINDQDKPKAEQEKMKKNGDELRTSKEKMNEYFTLEDGGEVPEGLAKYFKWSKANEVFIVSDYGPQGDGTEAEETVIKECK